MFAESLQWEFAFPYHLSHSQNQNSGRKDIHGNEPIIDIVTLLRGRRPGINMHLGDTAIG